MAEEAKGPRTETVVRSYDAEGALVSETTTVITVATPKADGQPDPGCYL
jgi:hypothetical protein